MEKLICIIALAIIGGRAPNTIEQCPDKQQLESKIAKARESIRKFQSGHVIVGRVVLDGPGDVRYVNAQMEILPDGYFVGPVNDLVRPVGFRLHQYAPYDLQLEDLEKDKEKNLLDVGTIHLKPLAKDKLADLKASVLLEDAGDLSKAVLLLSIGKGPVNTPSNSTEPRPVWPEPIKVPVQQNGRLKASGFSPAEYQCRLEAPGYLDKDFPVEFKQGQTLDLGTITLEKPKQIRLSFIVSKEPPFDINDLKTVTIPAGAKWKATDDIYGWDLQFRQDKGSVIMDYSYAPCYLWDLGEGDIEQYVDTGKTTTPPATRNNWQAGNGHVYLLHQAHWQRWVLFKIFIEDGLEIEKPTDKLVEASVNGRLIDEEGKPLSAVKWLISGIEELHDGHWMVVQRSGIPREHITGEDGRFTLEFRENLRYDLQFDKWGFGPAFVYQISQETPEINVVMKKGIPIRGSVTRLANGIQEPVTGTQMVELRLPNPRGSWYLKRIFTDHEGKFKCFASPPPQLPIDSRLACESEEFRQMLQSPKWQVVCAGEIVVVDVEEGKQIEEVHFEIQVKVTHGAVQQQD